MVAPRPESGNLPEPRTKFVGRHEEREHALEALAGSRLLVLTGAGGAGKTRLALELAASSTVSFPAGMWWVELDAVTNGDQVGATLANVLGVRPLPGRTHAQAVVMRLADEQALVVLDNCEHVSEAAADLCEALLRGCPRVVVLATSRTPLRVPDEWDWRVPSLSPSDASALFVDRAGRARPGFALDDVSAAAVARICREVDGLPLAIELAAARVRMLSVPQLADRLSDRFGLLTGGPRGARPRQQTLRASVDWSYELLSDEERSLMRRLAVFVGGWSLEAAEAVCSDPADATTSVLDTLTSLIDSSLVLAEQVGEEFRYRFLETVRQYALELLVSSGERDALRERHLDFFLALSARAAGKLSTPDVVSWLDALDSDAANIDAAITYSIEHRPQDALRLTVALIAWWKLRAQYGAARRALGRALDVAGTEPSAPRARALWGAAFMARFSGDVESAMSLAPQALAMAEAVDDPWTQAAVLQTIASGRMFVDPGGAIALCERALELARRDGDWWAQMSALVTLARSHMFRDDHTSADLVLAGTADVVAHMGIEAEYQLAHAAGWSAMTRGELGRGAELCERAAAGADALGDALAESIADVVMSWIELMHGQHASALERCRASEARLVARGAFLGLPAIRTELARALAGGGDLKAARELLGVVLEGAVDGGWASCRALVALADVLRSIGDLEGAQDRAKEALEISERCELRLLSVSAREQAALVHIAKREWAEAEALLQDALARSLDIDCPLPTAALLDALAEVANGLESSLEAQRLLGAADRARRDLGIVRWSLRVDAIEKLAQTLRTNLGDDAAAAARAEGAAMTTAQAVAWVRRARGSRKRPSGGWEALTPTEERVVELIVEGLSNPAIAERMYISRGTVKVHLGHVYDKLDVHSRSELAALAARRSR